MFHYGVRGTPLKLLASYLDNRVQCTKITDTKCFLHGTCGEYQGSIVVLLRSRVASRDCLTLLALADNCEHTVTFVKFSKNQLQLTIYWTNKKSSSTRHDLQLTECCRETWCRGVPNGITTNTWTCCVKQGSAPIAIFFHPDLFFWVQVDV